LYLSGHRVHILPNADQQIQLEQVKLHAEGIPNKMLVSASTTGKSLNLDLRSQLDISPRKISMELQRLNFRGFQQQVRLLNRAQITYFPQRNSVSTSGIRVAALGGRIEAAGAYRQRGWPRLALSAKLNRVTIPLSPSLPGPISGSINLTFSRQNLAAQAQLISRNPSMSFSLDATLPVAQYQQGIIPKISYDLSSQITLHAQQIQLHLLRPWLKPDVIINGIVDVAARIDGPLYEPRTQVTLGLKNFRYNQFKELNATLSASTLEKTSQLQLTIQQRHASLLALEARAEFSPGIFLRPPEVWNLTDTPLHLKLNVVETMLEELAWLEHSFLAQLKGQFSLGMQIQGTLEHPKIDLKAHLQKLNINFVHSVIYSSV
jgi:hypothetical protein